jgi:hypothetical protein
MVSLMLVVASLVLPFTAVSAKTDPIPTPLMRVVEPYTAKVGTEVVVTGENLDKTYIAEVYLSQNGERFLVEVTSHESTQIKFIVPKVKPGAYRITVLTTSAEPMLIEEPVRLVVEE